MSTSLLCLTFKEPIFQSRLLKEDLNTLAIGVIFSIDTITYTLTSFLLNFVPEKSKNFGKIVSLGMFVFIVAMYSTGPGPFLPDTIWMICIGTLLQGVGGALVNNNVVPALSQALQNEFTFLDSNTVKNNLSAINTGAFGLGSILGPIIASELEFLYGFRRSFDIITILVAGVAILQFISAFMKK
jgi:MFS family permease